MHNKFVLLQEQERCKTCSCCGKSIKWYQRRNSFAKGFGTCNYRLCSSCLSSAQASRRSSCDLEAEVSTYDKSEQKLLDACAKVRRVRAK